MALTFEEATISVTGCFDGQTTSQKTYPGKVATGIGLGYWIGEAENEQASYALVHVLSGYGLLPSVLGDESIMQSIIEQLTPLWDWNRPLEELATDPASLDIQQKAVEVVEQHVAQHPAAFGI